jgi:hypothetical protein
VSRSKLRNLVVANQRLLVEERGLIVLLNKIVFEVLVPVFPRKELVSQEVFPGFNEFGVDEAKVLLVDPLLHEVVVAGLEALVLLLLDVLDVLKDFVELVNVFAGLLEF